MSKYNNHAFWIKSLSEKSSVAQAEELLGLRRYTLSRRLKAHNNTLDAGTIIAIAEAYDSDPVLSLLNTKKITDADLVEHCTPTDDELRELIVSVSRAHYGSAEAAEDQTAMKREYVLCDDHEMWIRSLFPGSTVSAAAEAVGCAVSTLTRVLKKDRRLPAERILDIASAYSVNPLRALVETRYLDQRYAPPQHHPSHEQTCALIEDYARHSVREREHVGGGLRGVEREPYCGVLD